MDEVRFHRPRDPRFQGFSLVELLLVLAIIGILSAIAIPSYLGQRRRARVIGDAQSTTKTIQMALESRRAENGIYAASGTVVTWNKGVPSDSTFLPTLKIANTTQMNYSVKVTNGGLGYALTVTDPFVGSAQVLTSDQTGAITLNATYNK